MKITGSVDKGGTNKQYAKFRPLQDDVFLFAKIWDATLVMDPNPDPAVSNYIWRYEISPAEMTWTGIGAIPSTAYKQSISGVPTPLWFAFSISELGNPTGNYSYGNDPANFPTGIVPVRIPDGTPVLCRAMRNAHNGQTFYLIINTQAITGACS